MKLWSAQAVSVFGSLITRTALPFTAILVLGATPLQMSLLMAGEMAPGLLISLIAGVWVDRLRRRPLMIGADLGRALLLGSIPAAALLGLLRIEHLYVVALLTGGLTVLFDVAYRSYLPSIVSRDRLVQANSRLTATESAAEVGAFGLGGWLVQLLTAPIAVLMDAVSFLFSALFLGLIRTPEPAPRHDERGRDMRREIAEGLREVLGHQLLLTILGSSLILHLTGGVFAALYLLYTSRDLGFQPGVLGLIFAVGGVSSLLGALLAGRTTRRLGTGQTMLAGLLVAGVVRLFVPLAQDSSVAAASLLVTQQLIGDGALTLYLVNQVSLIQSIAPGRLLGRVNASMQFVEQGALVVGILAGGVLGEAIGPRATLLLASLVAILGVFWLAASPLRKVRDAN